VTDEPRWPMELTTWQIGLSALTPVQAI
jgi:hypothetical protein